MTDIFSGAKLLFLIIIVGEPIAKIIYYCSKHLTSHIIDGIRTLTNNQPKEMFRYSKFYKED